MVELIMDWYLARTLQDLGVCTQEWLEGRLEAMHGNPPYGNVHAESRRFLPYLAPGNRHGTLITIQSQPGCLPGNRSWGGMVDTQRAAVQGFVPEYMLRPVFGLSRKRPWLSVRARKPRPRSENYTFPVSKQRGREVTWFGHTMGVTELAWRYGQLHPDLLIELLQTWQVLLVDQEWGRNDKLWPMLREQFV